MNNMVMSIRMGFLVYFCATVWVAAEFNTSISTIHCKLALLYHKRYDMCMDRDGFQKTLVQQCQKLSPACSAKGFIYVSKGSFCYKDYTWQKVTWNRANRTCRNDGGMLIQAETEEKHEFITNLGELKGLIYQWIGGHRESRSRSPWKWLDGTVIEKTYWRRGAPDPWYWNKCLRYCRFHGAYLWEDAACSHVKGGFVCEVPVNI